MNLYIPRSVNLKKYLEPGKVLVIYGPRQAGKTTLVKKFLETINIAYKYVTADDIDTLTTLSYHSLKNVSRFIGDYKLIVIDEAQRIPNIGLTLKLMVDNFPDRYFIVTGSSSLDLASKTAEPLTGRKKIIKLLPIWLGELNNIYNLSQIKRDIHDFLIYGMYPEVITEKSLDKKEEKLSELASSYLLKDVLAITGIKRVGLILKLLKMLAWQIGSEVSLNELSSNLSISIQTVQKYLDILEDSFVIFHIDGFSRNLRKEIVKSSKYYFFDIGIRNAIISNFNKILDRDDKGAIWENFVIVERIKKHLYTGIRANYYFWRTYDKQEIDWIEEYGGGLYAYEFKYKPKNVKVPRAWQKAYPNATFGVVSLGNFTDFVI